MTLNWPHMDSWLELSGVGSLPIGRLGGVLMPIFFAITNRSAALLGKGFSPIRLSHRRQILPIFVPIFQRFLRTPNRWLVRAGRGPSPGESPLSRV